MKRTLGELKDVLAKRYWEDYITKKDWPDCPNELKGDTSIPLSDEIAEKLSWQISGFCADGWKISSIMQVIKAYPDVCEQLKNKFEDPRIIIDYLDSLSSEDINKLLARPLKIAILILFQQQKILPFPKTIIEFVVNYMFSAEQQLERFYSNFKRHACDNGSLQEITILYFQCLSDLTSAYTKNGIGLKPFFSAFLNYFLEEIIDI